MRCLAIFGFSTEKVRAVVHAPHIKQSPRGYRGDQIVQGNWSSTGRQLDPLLRQIGHNGPCKGIARYYVPCEPVAYLSTQSVAVMDNIVGILSTSSARLSNILVSCNFTKASRSLVFIVGTSAACVQ